MKYSIKTLLLAMTCVAAILFHIMYRFQLRSLIIIPIYSILIFYINEYREYAKRWWPMDCFGASVILYFGIFVILILGGQVIDSMPDVYPKISAFVSENW